MQKDAEAPGSGGIGYYHGITDIRTSRNLRRGDKFTNKKRFPDKGVSETARPGIIPLTRFCSEFHLATLEVKFRGNSTKNPKLTALLVDLENNVAVLLAVRTVFDDWEHTRGASGSLTEEQVGFLLERLQSYVDNGFGQ